jgi:hypothetical protein
MHMRRHLFVALVLAIAALSAACSAAHATAPPAAVTKTVIVTQTPKPTPTATPAPATPPSTTTAPSLTAETVVEEYFAAINSHDYRAAWNLGGFNFVPDYATFADDFAGTVYDTVTVTGAQGGTVSIHLEATQSDGSVKIYTGTYTASKGILTGASVQQVGTVPPPSASVSPPGVILAPNGDYYRDGEFCPDADAGLTTKDASGNTLTCVLESGAYHWR